MFLIKSYFKMCLYSNVYDAYLFLEISENKNTDYLYTDFTVVKQGPLRRVINFVIKILSGAKCTEQKENGNNILKIQNYHVHYE